MLLLVLEHSFADFEQELLVLAGRSVRRRCADAKDCEQGKDSDAFHRFHDAPPEGSVQFAVSSPAAPTLLPDVRTCGPSVQMRAMVESRYVTIRSASD